jgi:hypothetical protein
VGPGGGPREDASRAESSRAKSSRAKSSRNKSNRAESRQVESRRRVQRHEYSGRLVEQHVSVLGHRHEGCHTGEHGVLRRGLVGRGVVEAAQQG